MPPYASGYRIAPKRKRVFKAKKSFASYKSKLIKSIVGAERKGPELKNIDLNDAGGSPIIRLMSTTMTLDLLNEINQGSAGYQRLGRSICMKSLLVTGAVFPSGNVGTTSGEYVRVCVVYDRQVNGVAPAYADIYKTVDSAGNTSSTSFDMPNLDNEDRFIILADEQWSFPNTGLTVSLGVQNQDDHMGDQTQKTSISRYIKLKDLPVNYAGTGGGLANVLTGALYLITIGSQAAASAGATFNYATRIRYTDA